MRGTKGDYFGRSGSLVARSTCILLLSSSGLVLGLDDGEVTSTEKIPSQDWFKRCDRCHTGSLHSKSWIVQHGVVALNFKSHVVVGFTR